MLYSTIFPSKINFILFSSLMFYKNTTIQYCVSSKNYADCNKCLKFHKMFSNSSIRNRNIALFLVIAVCSPIFQHLEIYRVLTTLGRQVPPLRHPGKQTRLLSCTFQQLLGNKKRHKKGESSTGPEKH